MYLSRLEDQSIENDTLLNGGTGKVEGNIPDTYGLGTDNTVLGREDFSLSCLSMLFSLCSESRGSNSRDVLSDESKARARLAKMVSPYLLKRTRGVIQSYIVDRPLFGNCPLPRIRNEEVLFILDHLEKLHLIESILDSSRAKRMSTIALSLSYIYSDDIHRLLLSGNCGLLFSLYPDLCDLLVAVSQVEDGAIPGSDESKISDSVRLCLGRIGFELGFEA